MRSNARTVRPLGLVGALVSLALAAPGAARAGESWDAIYVGNVKVGSMHVAVGPAKFPDGRVARDDRGRDLLRVTVEWKLTFQRDQGTARMRLLYGTIETPEGAVLKLDTRTEASGEVIRTSGEVKGDSMRLTLATPGGEDHREVPWGPDVRGPYGAELSLSRRPLKPGEKRDVKTYIPDINRVCLTRLAARDVEAIELGGRGEKKSLLRVEQDVTELDGKPIAGLKSTLWVDDSGQIMKSRTDLLGGMLTFRTTKKAATSEGTGKFDLLAGSIVKIARRIPNWDRSRAIVYRVTMPDDDPAEVFPGDQRQAVRKESAHVARIEVRTDGPAAGQAGPARAGDQFVRPNPLVNSDDPMVIEHMKAAVGDRTDPWEKARAITGWVFKNLRKKNFNVAFAPAREVARDLQGDCTEHGVLTAAMCRAADIPARCVVGLVYTDQRKGFGPHMWNEVYIDGRWIAVDSAFDETEVDATHLKIADTSLDGVAPFEAFLPVIRVFKALKIEPLEVR